MNAAENLSSFIHGPESSDFRQHIVDAALLYIRRGWAVIPLYSVDQEGVCNCDLRNQCEDKGKHPAVGSGSSAASKDEAKIREWFKVDGPARNVAIVTGKVSGLTVLDIDIGLGKLGVESWRAAIDAGGEGEPVTLVANTGSGGAHYFFKYNSAVKNASNWLGQGVDSRNDKGYVVAAPSRHRSGGVYSWVDLDVPLADLPSSMATRVETRGRKKGSSGRRYTIEEFKRMLEFIPSTDRDLWIKMGIIAGREYNRSQEAWEAYFRWAEKDCGVKGRNHDAIMSEAFNVTSQKDGQREASMGTVVALAIQGGWVPTNGGASIEQFTFLAPAGGYVYRPTGQIWTASNIDKIVDPVNVSGRIIRASDWIASNARATSTGRCPQFQDEIIRGHDISAAGELIENPTGAVLNAYQHVTMEPGDAALAAPFSAHVHRVFNKPGDADQFLDYMAHLTQRPWMKPRFALLIAGGEGVGKDTAVEFCCPSIGYSNIASISTKDVDSQFNEFAAATLVRINESSDPREVSKYVFAESVKNLIAGTPDVCTINPKYGIKHAHRMNCGVIITTNSLETGVYFSPDDRRYDVIEAATRDEMGLADDEIRREYFEKLWLWFREEDGERHVYAFLLQRSLAKFSPDAGQRKTAAHRKVILANAHMDDWLDECLDERAWPDAIRADWVIKHAESRGHDVSKVKSKMLVALRRKGYEQLPSENKDPRWLIDGKKHTVYVKRDRTTPVDFAKELSGDSF